jgi:hypothetical protein
LLGAYHMEGDEEGGRKEGGREERGSRGSGDISDEHIDERDDDREDKIEYRFRKTPDGKFRTKTVIEELRPWNKLQSSPSDALDSDEKQRRRKDMRKEAMKRCKKREEKSAKGKKRGSFIQTAQIMKEETAIPSGAGTGITPGMTSATQPLSGATTAGGAVAEEAAPPITAMEFCRISAKVTASPSLSSKPQNVVEKKKVKPKLRVHKETPTSPLSHEYPPTSPLNSSSSLPGSSAFSLLSPRSAAASSLPHVSNLNPSLSSSSMATSSISSGLLSPTMKPLKKSGISESAASIIDRTERERKTSKLPAWFKRRETEDSEFPSLKETERGERSSGKRLDKSLTSSTEAADTLYAPFFLFFSLPTFLFSFSFCHLSN